MSHEPLKLISAKVLVVDDTPANITLLCQMLEPMGYSLSFATSGEQALQLTPIIQPHLILLDMVMPGLDGLETCRRLKADQTTWDIPVVFVTGRSEVQDVLDGFEAGGSDYVTKPICAPELLARVRAHLELHVRRLEEHQLVRDLQESLQHVKLLSGLVPICGSCKKIRDDRGFWQQLEAYLEAHSEAKLSYSLCPDCIHEHYPHVPADSKLGGEGRPEGV